MVRLLMLFIVLVLTTVCSARQLSNQQLYQTLDSLIEQYNQLTADKERRVAIIKDGVKGLKLTPEQQYDLNQRRYDEYVAYKFDSAF